MGRGRSDTTLALVQASYEILEEIQPASVRAVCYRLFILGRLSSMSKNETAKMSHVLARAREAGEIPWEWICDESREMEQAAQWSSTDDFMKAAKQSYRKDHWALQPTRVEVWSEKGTIRGCVQPVLNEFGVGFRVMHGYGSATVLKDVATAAMQSEKPWVVLYIGDFDPSGLHMSLVDLPQRLQDYGSGPINIHRIALTEDDVRHGRLPSFPLASKKLDTRYAWFRDQVRWTRGKCWEVDALSPVILRDRLRTMIQTFIEPVQWARSVLAETAEQSSIHTFVDGWKVFQDQSGNTTHP